MKRLPLLILSLSILSALLGCGGGSGGNSSVTRKATVKISLEWPTVNKSLTKFARKTNTRALPSSPTFTVIEAFVGVQLNKVITFSTGKAGDTGPQDVELPYGDVTFYVNAYAAQPPVIPVTDPATGRPKLNAQELADNKGPIASAVTTVTINGSPNQQIPFTLNSTVSKIVPDPNLTTVYDLQIGVLDNLKKYFHSVDTLGRIVVVAKGDDPKFPTDYIMSLDSSDIDSSRVGFNSITGDITPSASGQVRFKVSLNPNIVSNPVSNPSDSVVPSVIISFIIKNPTAVLVSVDKTLLMSAVPTFAKSIRLIVTQQSLGGSDFPTDTSNTSLVTQTATVDSTNVSGPFTLDINTLSPSVTFVNSGRKFMVTVEAWSKKSINNVPQGVLIASTSSNSKQFTNSLTDAGLKPFGNGYVFSNAGVLFDPATDYKVSGFSILAKGASDPINPVIYPIPTGQTVAGHSDRVQLSVGLKGSGIATTDDNIIDPYSVSWQVIDSISGAIITDPPYATVDSSGLVISKQKNAPTIPVVTKDTGVMIKVSDPTPGSTLSSDTKIVTVKPIESILSGGYN